MNYGLNLLLIRDKYIYIYIYIYIYKIHLAAVVDTVFIHHGDGEGSIYI